MQLSPNASRVLLALGLGPQLQPLRGRSGGASGHETRRRRGCWRGRRSARPRPNAMARPIGSSIAATCKPCCWNRCARIPAIALTSAPGSRTSPMTANGVTISARRAARRSEERGVALIAADGLWSSLRRRLGDRTAPRFARHTAWRALAPADAVPADQRAPAIDLWFGQQRPPRALSRTQRRPHQYRCHHPRRLARARLERPGDRADILARYPGGSVVTGGARRAGRAAAMAQMGALRPRAACALGPGAR